MDLTAAFSKSFPGGATITADFRLELDRFGLTVLFGPSGCGKTTVLRCLAGLERPDAGEICAGDETWCHAASRASVPAHNRRIGFVFQEAALFPHLTVAQNIAYGLRGWPRAERKSRVAELGRLTGLDPLLARRPGQLSGGQKQRVALARALAPRPRLVLLDEPFAALDRGSAEQLRHNLREILQTLEAPAVLVTHDPQEALALGDRMLLMEAGRIIREGTPADVLSGGGRKEDPSAMGAVLRARVVGRTEGLLRLAAGPVELFAPDPGGDFQEAYACIRGEGVSLESTGEHRLSQRNHLAASVVKVEPLGALQRVHLDAGVPLQAMITTWALQDLDLAQGRPVQANIKASAIEVIPIEK